MSAKVERESPGLEAIDELFGVDAFCCFLTEEDRPLPGALGFLDFRLCGALSRVVKSGFFKGEPGEKLLVPTDGRVPAGKVFVVGLGQRRTMTPAGVEHALASAASMVTRAGAESVALTLPLLSPSIDAVRAELVERGFAANFSGRVVLFDA
jgi:hypothetical protein